jgi:hypothetical protein
MTQADLVARLRKKAILAPWDLDFIIRDAAAEIERLRASNKQLREALGQLIAAWPPESSGDLLGYEEEAFAVARAALKDAPNE